MSKAQDFVDQFERAANIIANKWPKDITYCVFIYARSPDEKSEKFPDGDLWFKWLDRTTYYDRRTIEQYMKEYRRLDWRS
jgi:hypothetical protein